MIGGVLSVVLYLVSLLLYYVACQGECTDLRGRTIGHGLHYVPGPDTCQLCVCDNGLPKVCKAVLCSPPQDCRSFRVGNTCCEFICLDDVVKPVEGTEANVRIAAGGAAAIVLLAIALVVYRVRRQKRRRPPHADDQRSLTSIGYISGSMGYMGGTCETALGAWKPSHNYMPRGEAPPPYDEAVAQCRQEQARQVNEQAFHRTYPAMMETMARPDDLQCTGHGYANVPRPIITQQIANPANCYNAPLLQTVHPPEYREPGPMPHLPLAPSVVGFPSTVRLTGSLGAISNRGLLSLLQREPEPERPHNVPGFYVAHTATHRTIPRISTAIDTTALEGFNRADRSLVGEVRRSFHRPNEARLVDTGRSMPRNLNLASHHDVKCIPPPSRLRGPECRARSEERDVGAPGPAPHALTLPLTVDKPSCVCSYAGAEAAAGAETAAGATEDADDYRSECENCKSASSSRWVLEEGWVDEQEDGTQTLQRRAPPPPPPPPATATLPQPVTKPRTLGQPSNWENWFNTIPDSDTESEE